MAIRMSVTEKGLLIPRDVAERVLGEGAEVEMSEEPGRLILTATSVEDQETIATVQEADPIDQLGRNPVHSGVRDGSANHDLYLYGSE